MNNASQIRTNRSMARILAGHLVNLSIKKFMPLFRFTFEREILFDRNGNLGLWQAHVFATSDPHSQLRRSRHYSNELSSQCHKNPIAAISAFATPFHFRNNSDKLQKRMDGNLIPVATMLFGAAVEHRCDWNQIAVHAFLEFIRVVSEMKRCRKGGNGSDRILVALR